MAAVMLLGTLNRVMIVELSVPAVIVAVMIALPVLVAPFRALLGFRSDTHRSAIGWKRVPYLWFGTLWQMGGLAVMPMALLVLGGDVVHEVPFAGEVLAALAFLMTGLGIHMTQTAGLALAADRASDETRPRVVALLYVMFLIGMGVSALVDRLAAARFHAAAADPGGAGGRGRDGGPERDRALEAGARAADEPRRSARRRGRASPMPGRILPRAARRGGCWSSCSSERWRSTCRTCCSSPTAARSSVCRCRPPRC